MPLSGMLTCGNCGTRTQMNTMRYNLTGSKLICPDCIDKERSSIKPGTTHATSGRLQREQAARDVEMKTRGTMTTSGSSSTISSPAESSTVQMRSQPAAAGMVNYYCTSCHYKFSRKRDVQISSCPYCGRDSVSLAYEGKAQDLIEESTRAEEDRFNSF